MDTVFAIKATFNFTDLNSFCLNKKTARETDKFTLNCYFYNWRVSSVVITLLSVRGVWGSISGSVKLITVSSMTHHRCDVSRR